MVLEIEKITDFRNTENSVNFHCYKIQLNLLWFLSIAKIKDFRDPKNAKHFYDIQIPCNVFDTLEALIIDKWNFDV